MKKKIINKRINGDSEELHALKGFKVLAVGNGTIGEVVLLLLPIKKHRFAKENTRFYGNKHSCYCSVTERKICNHE